MTSATNISLVAQRQALREKLLAQRQLIANQLDHTTEVDNSYPRSKTMRFLTRRPALAVALLTGLAALLGGARSVKSLTAILAVARIVGSTSITGPRRVSAPRTSD